MMKVKYGNLAETPPKIILEHKYYYKGGKERERIEIYDNDFIFGYQYYF
jgi:hypothetical protein